MNTKKHFVIKPTTHNRKKVTYGDELILTESQARPLRHGGFITRDEMVAKRITELAHENEALKNNAISNKAKDTTNTGDKNEKNKD